MNPFDARFSAIMPLNSSTLTGFLTQELSTRVSIAGRIGILCKPFPDPCFVFAVIDV